MRDPALAELLAGTEGVMLANQQGHDKIVLEMDSLEMVSKLKNATIDRSIYGSLIEELKFRCSSFSDFRVVWCRREANGCAHVLAKAGCYLNGSDVWFGVPPLFLEPLLCKDMYE